jgi:ATP-dependent DNA ligase
VGLCMSQDILIGAIAVKQREETGCDRFSTTCQRHLCLRPELVVEVTYLTWTDDGFLRHVVYEGVREDNPLVTCAGPPSPARPSEFLAAALFGQEWVRDALPGPCGYWG